MDRGERTLVPEWYRGSANSGNSSGNSNHQNGSASNPNDHGVRPSSRNRLSRDRDPPRSSRNSSSFRRSMSSNSNGCINSDRENSSYSRSYSSFGRNHPNRDRDNDFHNRGSPCLVENGFSHHTDSLVVSRTERDSLTRSNSTSSERRVDLWGKKPGSSNSRNGLPGSISTISKPSFEKEFPSLGSAERQLEVPRLSSPGLSTAMDSLSKITPTTIGGEGWVSALAEVPVKVLGSGTATSSIPQTTSEPLPSSSLSSSTGLNMAETLAQAPLRNSTTPKMSIDTKKSEEFTRIQYSKLIPVTPTLPKSLASSTLEKAKPKAIKSSELSGSSKVGLHVSSQPVNQNLRAPPKTENTKVSQGGNFQVLTRDMNGTIPAKDSLSLTNASKVSSVSTAAATVNPSRTAITLKPKLDNRGVTGSSVQSLPGEKRVSSQAQNRHDFFNSIRKKTLNRPDASTAAVVTRQEKSGQENTNFLASLDQDKETHGDDAGSECPVENVTAAASTNIITELFMGCSVDEMPSTLVTSKDGGVVEVASNHVVENYTFPNNCPMLVPDEPRSPPLSEEGTNSVDNRICRTENEEDIWPAAVMAQSSLTLCEDDGSSPNSLPPPSFEVGDNELVAAPSEEEAAFLRELGWDENADADGDEITAEEIEDFVRQHPEQMTSLRLGLIGFGSESPRSGVTTGRP